MQRATRLISAIKLLGVVAVLVNLLSAFPTAAAQSQSIQGRQGSASVSFATAITVISPLLYPSSLAAGDLNHSGIPGLAVVSADNNAPLVYALGKGNGRFRQWRQNDNVGYAPGFVLLADVDGDGNLDAITTDIGAGDLNVAFGDGKGHLYGGRRLLVDGVESTYSVAVADLNGDGIPDIVGTTNNGIFVISGEGSGKFAKAVTFGSGGDNPYGIAVGDLNNDGIPDLVVANWGQDAGPYGNLAVLLGKGDGTFAKPVTYHAGIHPAELTLADLNEDGNLDVAVTSNLGVYVFLGKGDGTLSPPKVYHPGDYPSWVLSADFNGDGIPDLAVANNTNPKPCHVTILLGKGDGTFQSPIAFRVGDGPTGLITADFNHDGKPDLATLTGPSGITVLLNTTQFPTQSPSH
jgi:hypothetical protein